MDILSPQEKPPEEVSDAEREGILWDATWRYMRGEITAYRLQEIKDRHSLHIRKRQVSF